MMLFQASTPARGSIASPLFAALVAIAIFTVDTVTTLDIAVAVLYVAVVLLALDFTGFEGLLAVAAGCMLLTVLSFAISHGADPDPGAILRGLVSLAAITITALLAARNQRAVRALREQASLLDLTHDTIFVRARNDVITSWNRAATELYGWRREEAIGRRAAQLLDTVFPAPQAAIMDELERTGRWEGELIHTARDGRHVTVTSRWALQSDARGRPVSILETNNDITAQRAVEDKLHRSRMELAHVSRIATLGELTASIAHEVNQPLAAVVANGEAGLRWLNRPVPELGQAKTTVEAMIRNARRASDVIVRLRALSRKADTVQAPLSIAELVEQTTLLVERELRIHEVQLSTALPADLPPVLGDRVQLQQVLINLLINAIQALDSVAADRRALSIGAERAVDEACGDVVVVRFDDSGPGIPDDVVVRLFDAFFTTKSEGMGMGLSICRSIVEAHGGRISAVNRPEGGASFRLALPIAPAGAA
ncbi:MAG TPA: ATP-binding protein [Reyranella sp.]|nr:ATP-binding protein [Reyranella sp.]